MTDGLYQIAVGDSSALKIRAKALLAEGGEHKQWEAIVLLHEAARTEQRALKALDRPSPQLRLRSLVERCGCLLDATDLPAAVQVYGEIRQLLTEIEASSCDRLCVRIEAKYDAEVRRFQSVLKQAPTYWAVRATGSAVASEVRLRSKLLQEYRRLLQHFPGTPLFWWGLYRNHEAAGALTQAWTALEKAAVLDPESSTYAALKLYLGPKVLDRAATKDLLAQAYWSLREAAAEVCLHYALAEYHLLEGQADTERIKRIRRALQEGESRSGVPQRLRSYLRGVAFALDETIDGRKPTLDVLYRCGLGDLAIALEASRASTDPIELIVAAATRTG